MSNVAIAAHTLNTALRKPPKPALSAVRIGDFMRVADSLKLVLEVAELAVAIAEQAGASSREIAALRQQLVSIRAMP